MASCFVMGMLTLLLFALVGTSAPMWWPSCMKASVEVILEVEHYRWRSSKLDNLADEEKRLQKVRSTMWVVPETRWLASHTGRGYAINLQSMGIAYLGKRHSRSFPFGHTSNEVPCGSYRVLHQIDWSRARCPNHCPQGATFHMEVHSIRFGVPTHLVLENGTQFANLQLGKLCLGLEIKQIFTTVEHPQTNG